MQAVIFIGIQGTGKSSFFKTSFFDTHVRINLDMLRTKRREEILLRACLEARQPFVVDNTNVTAAGRARYIEAAKSAGFRVIGYYFRANVREAIKRNDQRSGKRRVPVKAIFGTRKRLEVPNPKEGFDELYCVRIDSEDRFVVEEWQDEGEIDRRDRE